MKANSTLLGKSILLFALLLTFTTATNAQSTVNMKFVRPVLYSGTAGAQGAVYKFSNIIPGVYALVTIAQKINGATLVNIDDTTMGYYNAWQPIVGGPGIANQSSEIRWDIDFFDAADGKKHKFSNFDISAIDIDGDNVAVREYVTMNAEDSYNVPTAIPTLMGFNTTTNPYYQNNGDDSPNDLKGLGPVANRAAIDTVALDTRANYKFKNKKKISLSTGANVLPYTNSTANPLSIPETASAIATDRYYSLYFKPVSNVIVTILPVTLRTFDAIAVNNKAANLFWITEAETDNDHFEVERSFDQKNFTKVGIVLGAQSSTKTAQQYSFKDNSSELSGHSVIYYRLRQVDRDDNFKYSPIKTVRLASDTKTFVQVSPNPYMDKLNVNFVSEEAGIAQVRLMNVTGQVTSSKESVISKGYNNFQMGNLNTVAPGIYTAELVINGKTIATQRVVKQ